MVGEGGGIGRLHSRRKVTIACIQEPRSKELEEYGEIYRPTASSSREVTENSLSLQV